MTHYSAFDLVIDSSFELPELPIVDRSAEPDVTIRRADLDPVPTSVEAFDGRRITSKPGQFKITYRSIGTFVIRDGERVACDPATDDVSDKKGFRRLVENEVLAMLLQQRGLLVLHGSAVLVDGNAVVFLGKRGTGKSTTAAAFHSKGYQVFEDDTVAIRYDEDVPRVVSGVPELRLMPDAAAALGLDETTVPLGDWGPEKCYLHLDTVPEPAPIATCYVLRDGPGLAIEDLTGHERLLHLISRTYIRGLLHDAGLQSSHLTQCSTLLESAQFRTLERPKDLGALSSFVDSVVADVASAD